MVALPENFDPNAVEPSNFSFDPIPAGKYKLQVIDSKITETSTGSGQMLELTLEVMEGPFERRRIWDRLNIRNQSAQAQSIAQQSFRALCLSAGVDHVVKDSEELHWKPFIARVTIQTDKTGQYAPQNRVQYIDPSNTRNAGPATSRPNAQQAQRQAAQPAAGRPQAAPANKPWNNPHAAKAGDNKMDDEIPF